MLRVKRVARPSVSGEQNDQQPAVAGTRRKSGEQLAPQDRVGELLPPQVSHNIETDVMPVRDAQRPSTNRCDFWGSKLCNAGLTVVRVAFGIGIHQAEQVVIVSESPMARGTADRPSLADVFFVTQHIRRVR